MRTLTALWLGLPGMLCAGELTFPEMTKEVKLRTGEATVTADFPFTNNTDKTLVISDVFGNCSCYPKVLDGRKAFGPGESGVIRADFRSRQDWGTVENALLVRMEGDSPKTPPRQLTLRVDTQIPVLVEARPEIVKWELGEAPEAKTVQIRMNGGKPIHIRSVTSRSGFSRELKTIEEGRVYELTIKPVSTGGSDGGVFAFETDCGVEGQSTQYIWAGILPPETAEEPSSPVE